MKKSVLFIFGLAVGVAGLSPFRALGDEANESPQYLTLRLWSANYDTGYNDESGTLYSIFYDRPFASAPWMFTAKLGFGDVGGPSTELQIAFSRFWDKLAAGAGVHVISFGTDISKPLDEENYDSEDAGVQVGPDFFVGYSDRFTGSDFGYRVSATALPYVWTEDGSGTGYNVEGSVTYALADGGWSFAAGYRQQNIKQSSDSYWDDETFTYSGLFIEGTKAF